MTLRACIPDKLQLAAEDYQDFSPNIQFHKMDKKNAQNVIQQLKDENVNLMRKLWVNCTSWLKNFRENYWVHEVQVNQNS